jgi:dihydroorotase
LVDGLRAGIIDIIATDHAPHAFQDKLVPFEEATVGISVLETAFASLMGLVHLKELDIPTLVHRLTAGPAALLGSRFAELATLKPGTSADLVLFDPDLIWEVNSGEFISKGTNTPLDGTKMKGRVVFTLFSGKTVHDELPKSPKDD